MNTESKIYVAGHRGLVGSAIVRTLKNQGFTNLLLKTSTELDLRQQSNVYSFFCRNNPEYVIIAAAHVGGINANQQSPATFIYDNLQIQNNLIHYSYVYNVTKLLFLGSSCIYPKLAPTPIPESALLTGPLEPTNQWYAIAKICGIKMCQAYRRQYGCDFISIMPTSLYGPNDNYDLQTAHVLPALLRKFHEAKLGQHPHVVGWGTGQPRREFLHSDDLADAAIFLMQNYSSEEIINVGSGEDVTIAQLAEIIRHVTGFQGKMDWDTSKPDGTPRKLIDSSRLRNLGWTPKISLEEGIRRTYENFLAGNNR